MGGISTRILRRSGWQDAEGRVESGALDVRESIGLVIDIDGVDPAGAVWIEQRYGGEGSVFDWPMKTERFSGTSRIIIDTRYIHTCRFFAYCSRPYRYKYGFLYWWLMSDEEMKPAYKRFCGYNGDESYHLRGETY